MSSIHSEVFYQEEEQCVQTSGLRIKLFLSKLIISNLMMGIKYWQRDNIYLPVWSQLVGIMLLSVYSETHQLQIDPITMMFIITAALPLPSNDSKGKGRKAKWKKIHRSSELRTTYALCPRLLPYLLTETLSITFYIEHKHRRGVKNCKQELSLIIRLKL